MRVWGYISFVIDDYLSLSLFAGQTDVAVKLPMYGQINSLNVAVAAGILLYEAGRQREPQT